MAPKPSNWQPIGVSRLVQDLFGIGYCTIRTSVCAGGGVTAAIRRVQGGTATRQTKLLDGCQDGIQPN